MRKLTLIALIGAGISGCGEVSPVLDDHAYLPGVAIKASALRPRRAASSTGDSCGNGRVRCDAICVNTRNDVLHCGACGHVCPAYPYTMSTCKSSICTFGDCIGGHSDCDGDLTNGCEIVTGADAANCGACGHACQPGTLCVDGRCNPRGCATGTGDCDGNLRNGCEANTAVDNANCGACGVVCPSGEMCVDGGCQGSECDPASEVELGGHCYYLDGSGGICDPGYQLAPQSVLTTGMFVGRSYRHQVSDNCCVYNAEPDEDWGMGDHCNEPGPFTARDPESGAVGCINAMELEPAQLTLCYR